jgi:hypothetical protein
MNFLDDFQKLTGGTAHAFNTIGVLAKIDKDPDKLRRRDELAEKYALQLKSQLNTVIPVSAGLQWALQKLLDQNEAGLCHFIRVLRRIPVEQLTRLLRRDIFYLEERPSCPVSAKERQQLLEFFGKDSEGKFKIPWGVFKLIAESIADTTKNQETIKWELTDIAGFKRLQAVLERHFFKRQDLLRAHTVLQSAQKILNDVKSTYLQDLVREQEQVATFRTFLRRTAGNYAGVAQDLMRFIEKKSLPGNPQQLRKLIETFEQKIDLKLLQLQQYSDDFFMLQQLSETITVFTREEVEELQTLFGEYELDPHKRLASRQNVRDYIVERQIRWRDIGRRASHEMRRQIALHASTRYAYLLNEVDR